QQYFDGAFPVIMRGRLGANAEGRPVFRTTDGSGRRIHSIGRHQLDRIEHEIRRRISEHATEGIAMDDHSAERILVSKPRVRIIEVARFNRQPYLAGAYGDTANADRTYFLDQDT